MTRKHTLRFGIPALTLAVLALALGGCASRRGASACDPCAEPAPCAAPCAEPCAVVEAPPCPPQGKSGEVWCKVWVDPVTCMQAEVVCVKCAERKCQWVPPVYGTRPQLVCKTPARMQERRNPGVWKTECRDVLVRPAQEQWSPVCCPPITDANGCPVPQECWQKTCTPAVWAKEECGVCVQPETYGIRYTPAQYEVVEERYLVSPGRYEEVEVPPVFETRFREVCMKPGRWEWRRNTSCEPPPPEAPAIQVEMKDKDEAGAEAGVFRVGSVVRYDLTVLADQSKSAVENIKVVFALPPELEFVSGTGGQGASVTGSGQTAQSGVFTLPIGASVSFQVLARVKDAAAGTNIQFTATVETADGTTLAVETESSTIGGGGAQ